MKPLTPRLADALRFVRADLHELGVVPHSQRLGSLMGISKDRAWRYMQRLCQAGHLRQDERGRFHSTETWHPWAEVQELITQLHRFRANEEVAATLRRFYARHPELGP